MKKLLIRILVKYSDYRRLQMGLGLDSSLCPFDLPPHLCSFVKSNARTPLISFHLLRNWEVLHLYRPPSFHDRGIAGVKPSNSSAICLLFESDRLLSLSNLLISSGPFLREPPESVVLSARCTSQPSMPLTTLDVAITTHKVVAVAASTCLAARRLLRLA